MLLKELRCAIIHAGVAVFVVIISESPCHPAVVCLLTYTPLSRVPHHTGALYLNGLRNASGHFRISGKVIGHMTRHPIRVGRVLLLRHFSSEWRFV